MEDRGDPERQQLPAVLLDKVVFGVSFRVSNAGDDAVARMRHALRRAGFRIGRGGPGRMSLDIKSTSGDGVDSYVELGLASSWEDELSANEGSFIQLNGMRLLRASLTRDVGTRAFDGNDNLVGPTAHIAAQLLSQQLDLIEERVEHVAAVLQAALPELMEVAEQRLWLKSVEACVDHASTDAIAAVRSLDRYPLGGTIDVRRDLYQARIEDERGVPTVTYRRTKQGPALKVYAKRTDLVRTEVACRDRDQVAQLAGYDGCEFDGRQAAELLIRFARCAEPHVAELSNHLASANRSPLSVVDAFGLLRSLYDLATGVERSGPGRPVGPKVSAAAKRALEDLLQSGRCDVRGCVANNALGKALDGLAEPGGPLTRRGRARIYVMEPKDPSLP